jgi:hypothetical protein
MEVSYVLSEHVNQVLTSSIIITVESKSEIYIFPSMNRSYEFACLPRIPCPSAGETRLFGPLMCRLTFDLSS